MVDTKLQLAMAFNVRREQQFAKKHFFFNICTKVSKRFEIRKAPIVAELYVRKLKYWSNTNFKQMLSLASLKLHDIYITMHILLCLVCKRRICVM